MSLSAGEAKTLRAWRSVPRKIRRAVAGLSPRDLARRCGSEGWTIRETVHHLVEANLVMSNILLSALARPGRRYDWSWVVPDRMWMRRMQYDRAPVEPALALLEAMGAYVDGLLRGSPGTMKRHVRLFAGPGRKLERRTVRQLLEEQCEHARDHLRDIVSGSTRAGGTPTSPPSDGGRRKSAPPRPGVAGGSEA